MCLLVLIFESINTFVMYRIFHVRNFILMKNITGQKVIINTSKTISDRMDETSYLLISPKNAARLLESIENYKSGKGQERTLIGELR